MGKIRVLKHAQVERVGGSAPDQSFENLQEAVAALRPAKPLYVLFPDRIKAAAKDFLAAFPGKPMYAVKTNPHPKALKALWQAGVRMFDVASIEEVRLVRKVLPKSELYFMHPVKSPEAIREAYFQHGIRHFVLDHVEEMRKILRETGLAQDLKLSVRIALPKNESAMIDFSSKFGAGFAEAIELLKQCRSVSDTLGISFHVGTQTSDGSRWGQAISYCARLLRESGVRIDTLNVGGGFPVDYRDGESICTLQDCVAAMEDALVAEGLDHLPLLAEPGRILVAQGAVLVARVELRKGDLLYINDGIYGGLFDACDWLGLRYPVQAFRGAGKRFSRTAAEFRLAGPTCDSLDMMQGPFMLPADIKMGDWIAFENTGAYSQSLRSDFNGFGAADTVVVQVKSPAHRPV